MISVEKRDGQLHYNPLWMEKVVAGLKDGFHLLEFTSTSKRSSAQLKYYRGVVLPAFAEEAAGGSYTANDWHLILGGMFLRKEVEFEGQIYQGVKSTSDGGGMTVDDFRIYLDQVILYGAEEHGLAVPAPDTIGM